MRLFQRSNASTTRTVEEPEFKATTTRGSPEGVRIIKKKNLFRHFFYIKNIGINTVFSYTF